MDDLFIANKTRLHKIIEMLELRKITRDVSFSFSVRANLIDDEMCQTLKQLKIESVSFGAESGSNRILKLMNKNVTVAQNQNALDLLHKYKINVICSFIVGWPSENEKEVKKTFEFIANNVLQQKLPSTNAINILMPIPGTSLWDESIQSGKINTDQFEWDQLSVFADYQHSKLNNFKEWVAHRRQKKSLYLAEDTLPQERLYELIYEHYESMRKIQENQNNERKKESESWRQNKKIHEQISELEKTFSDQKAAIDRWKVSRINGQAADDTALLASSRFFQALLALIDVISASGSNYIYLKNVLNSMTDAYRRMEDVGKLIAVSEDLNGVNKIIDEQLIPKAKVFPSLIAKIVQNIDHYNTALGTNPTTH
jgi:radical SAM superfamily enzyme YgiQ (UPF0313 family)